MVGFPAQARRAISSTLAPPSPRSRNTPRAASRMRPSTSPARCRDGRPVRPAPWGAPLPRLLICGMLLIECCSSPCSHIIAIASMLSRRNAQRGPPAPLDLVFLWLHVKERNGIVSNYNKGNGAVSLLNRRRPEPSPPPWLEDQMEPQARHREEGEQSLPELPRLQTGRAPSRGMADNVQGAADRDEDLVHARAPTPRERSPRNRRIVEAPPPE